MPAPYFEGCLPIEEMAARGLDVLRFGPMKPVGLTDPRTGREPFAVVQLRQEDRAGQMGNLVGFQPRLKIPEQQRVLRLIPGLEEAEFLRFGSIHRNAYLNSPRALTAHLAARDDPRLLFAGQLTGVEGYTESAATGILAGINLARLLSGHAPVVPPPTTMLGALYRYVHTADPAHFQPMNANFGLLEPLDPPVRDKRRTPQLLAERAAAARATRTASLERKLPLYLTRADIDLLFAEAERRAAAGGFPEARDLAMLELFYSTGVRLAELAGLNDADVDLVSNQVKVRGKGKRERLVPLGGHAERALRRYHEHREALGIAGTADRRAVFVSRRGRRLTPRSVQRAIKRLLGAVPRGRELHVHPRRHSFATHLPDAA